LRGSRAYFIEEKKTVCICFNGKYIWYFVEEK